MAFRVLNFEEGRVVQLAAAASVTFLKGNAIRDNGVGFIDNSAANEEGDVQYICNEAIVTGGSTGELVTCYRVDPSVRISADCDLAPAQTDVGTLCDLGGAGTLNPNQSDDDLFYIESIDLSNGAVGTSTVVTGYFTQAVPNS